MQEGGQERWEAQHDPEYSQRLLAYLLRRYRAWLGYGALGMAVIAVIAGLAQPASYSTYATVKVAKSANPALSMLSALPMLGGSAPILDEMAVLASREIGLPVMEAAGTQISIYDPQGPDAPRGRLNTFLRRTEGVSRRERYERLRITDIDVSEDLLKEKPLWISADGQGNWKCEGQSGANGSPAVFGSFSFTPHFSPLHKAGDRYRLVVKPDHQAWTDFRNALGVRQFPQDSSFLRISFSHPNPWLAKEVVEMVLARYLKRNEEVTYGDFDTMLAFIADETAAEEAKLRTATEELKQYQETHGVYAPEAQGMVSVQAMADLSRRRTEDTIRLKQAEFLLGVLDQRSPDEIYAAIQAPGVADELEGESEALAGLLAELRVQRQTKTDAHPDVQSLQARIKSSIAALKEATETKRREAQASISQVSADIGNYRGELEKLPAATGKLSLLSAEIESSVAVLGLLKQQEATTKISRAGKSSEVRLMDSAPVPALRDSPKLGRSAALGAVGGMLLALLIALAVDANARGFRSLRELRLGAGLSVVGVLSGRPLGRNWQPGPAAPEAPELASQLLAGHRALGIVTLGGPRASHSLTWSLAQELAARGTPVVLLDMERSGQLGQAFKVPAVPGLAEVAAGAVPLDSAAREVQPGIRLLPAGRAQASAEQLAAAWVKLLDGGAVVLCVLPPPAQWTLHGALLGLLDGLVLSASQGRLPAGAIGLAAARLQQLGHPAAGVVVTEFSTVRDALGSAELPYLAVEAAGRG